MAKSSPGEKRTVKTIQGTVATESDREFTARKGGADLREFLPGVEYYCTACGSLVVAGGCRCLDRSKQRLAPAPSFKKAGDPAERMVELLDKIESHLAKLAGCVQEGNPHTLPIIRTRG